MTIFTASIETVALKFYLMMAIIIGSFASGLSFLALLALPVFLSALLGASFNSNKLKRATMSVASSQKNAVENKTAA